MSKKRQSIENILKILLGGVLFGVGFNLFMLPHDMNAGGISGLSMILVHIIGYGTVGTVTTLLNIPLFALGGKKIGKSFFLRSLVGMAASSLAIDLFHFLPIPAVDSAVSALYGGLLCGLGLGIVFAAGASTGGSDIIVRLLKQRWPNVSIGAINTCFDLAVVTLTGIVFNDMSRTLYCGIAIVIMGKVIDTVVYRFDDSRVAIIISQHHEEIAQKITVDMDRGVTLLEGEGGYTHNSTKVVLTAIKRQQLAELKKLVAEVDSKAFVIVQEAHQVLGDGFSHYSKDSI